MVTTRTMEEFRAARAALGNDSLGFVATMGALHQGHAELIRAARDECAAVCVSIFVNPTQFNNPEDYDKYPGTPEQDLELCKELGVDLVLAPSRSEVFGDDESVPQIVLSMPSLTGVLCGPGRPGHFEGVLYIVARFFNWVRPSRAYFGRKDFQQFTMVKTMARELGFPIEVIGLPTVRDEDGLALSSRNLRLSERAREHAGLIPRALRLAEKTFHERGADVEELLEITADVIASGSLNQVEYAQIVEGDTLRKLDTVKDRDSFVLAVGVVCGGVRLIDNLEIERQVSAWQ